MAHRRLVSTIISVFFLLTLPLFAQVDKGIIEVLVTDQSGAALPGVTVTVSRPDTGFSTVAVTGPTGTARFPALVPATYAVEATLDGFAAVKQDRLSLRVGQTQRLEFTLQAATSEAITVTAQAGVVDVYKQDTSSNIVPEQIEMLPVADRNFENLAFIAPGVQRERGGFRFITGGPVIGSGGNASQSTILVDGNDFTDPSLGLARTRFSQDAIQEFRVINNRFDSEIGGSAGGALSVVTRTGTNDLSGTMFGFYRDDSLREPNDIQTGELPYERSQYGITLGGPIVPDLTHFFVSLEQINQDDVVTFTPGGSFSQPTPTEVEHPFDQLLGFGSVTQQVTDSQTLAARVAYERYREDNFRVGGIASIEYGQELNRDNLNFNLDHSWTVSGRALNELRFQYGDRSYDEPTNSDAVAEWFSNGNTLQTGGNILGDLLGEGDMLEVRDTFHFSVGGRHHLKAGVSAQHLEERFRLDTYETGLFIYLTDTRAIPVAYAYGIGSGDARTDTNIFGAFINDEWQPVDNLTVNLGVRYDLDTDGNNPDFTHPLVPNGRDRDTDNVQPRLSFTWDALRNGSMVVRGGAGLFTGRFLLVPALTELQANGVTGRRLQTRVNGVLFGIPALALDPTRPTTTGIPLAPDITLLATDYEAPESTQYSLGMTTRLGSTGLYLDTEGVYIEGDKEIVIRDTNFRGNATGGRILSQYNQINMYTNDGRSEYMALIMSLNGLLMKKHILTASVTLSDKKNISDDFSPEFPTGYPNDPANIDAEWGHARSHEKLRVVLSGVFRMPWDVTVGPIFEYGSGQPWTRRLGYDYNGDGKNSDRAVGDDRFEREGPSFTQLSLRLTKGFALGGFGKLDLVAEAFNVTNKTNYDVASIDNAQYLSGPTLANPALPLVANPNFGRYRSARPGREIQLGIRWGF